MQLFRPAYSVLITVQRLPQVSVYNKTDAFPAFPFKVNRYCYPACMVSSKVHCTVILTQLIRFARIITEYQDFVLKCKDFFKLCWNIILSVNFLYSISS